MLRRWVLSLGLLLAFIALQSTWLGYIAVYAVVPDLSLLAVVFLAFKSPTVQGQSLGFVAGLIEDGISAAPFGLNAFVKAGVALLSNLLSGKFYIDRLLMPAVFGLAATLAKAGYLAVLALFFKEAVVPYDFASRALWIECAYNAVAAPILFLAMSPLERFLVIPERNR